VAELRGQFGIEIVENKKPRWGAAGGVFGCCCSAAAVVAAAFAACVIIALTTPTLMTMLATL